VIEQTFVVRVGYDLDGFFFKSPYWFALGAGMVSKEFRMPAIESMKHPAAKWISYFSSGINPTYDSTASVIEKIEW
jgi:hypothetical protein